MIFLVKSIRNQVGLVKHPVIYYHNCHDSYGWLSSLNNELFVFWQKMNIFIFLYIPLRTLSLLFFPISNPFAYFNRIMYIHYINKTNAIITFDIIFLYYMPWSNINDEKSFYYFPFSPISEEWSKKC